VRLSAGKGDNCTVYLGRDRGISRTSGYYKSHNTRHHARTACIQSTGPGSRPLIITTGIVYRCSIRECANLEGTFKTSRFVCSHGADLNSFHFHSLSM
jgi:hypothetical protein